MVPPTQTKVENTVRSWFFVLTRKLASCVLPFEQQAEKKVTNNRDINKTFILPLRSKLFYKDVISDLGSDDFTAE